MVKKVARGEAKSDILLYGGRVGQNSDFFMTREMFIVLDKA